MSEPSDHEALTRRIDALQTALRAETDALQTDINARQANDERILATLARLERQNRDLQNGQMRFRSEMDALRDTVRSATSGPLNEVQALKAALAEADAKIKTFIAQHAQDSASLARAQATQAMAEERANLLAQQKGGASAILPFPKEGKAPQKPTSPTARDLQEGSEAIEDQEEDQAARYPAGVGPSKTTASRARKLNKYDYDKAAQQQAQASTSASRIDTRSEGTASRKSFPNVSFNSRFKKFKQPDIRTLWGKGGKSAAPAHAEASAADAQASAAHAEASAPNVQAGGSNVQASAPSDGSGTSSVPFRAPNVQATASNVQASAADVIVVLSSEEEENMEPFPSAENVALGKKPPPTPSSGESSDSVRMPGKKARKQDSD